MLLKGTGGGRRLDGPASVSTSLHLFTLRLRLGVQRTATASRIVRSAVFILHADTKFHNAAAPSSAGFPARAVYTLKAELNVPPPDVRQEVGRNVSKMATALLT